jgi:hypothetical protein
VTATGEGRVPFTQGTGNSPGLGLPAIGGYVASSFSIEPQAIPALQASLTDIYHQYESFARLRSGEIMLQPLGSDPASLETAKRHNQKAGAAIKAIEAYASQLQSVIKSLGQQAARYHVTEATSAASFGGGNSAG